MGGGLSAGAINDSLRAQGRRASVGQKLAGGLVTSALSSVGLGTLLTWALTKKSFLGSMGMSMAVSGASFTSAALANQGVTNSLLVGTAVGAGTALSLADTGSFAGLGRGVRPPGVRSVKKMQRCKALKDKFDGARTDQIAEAARNVARDRGCAWPGR